MVINLIDEITNLKKNNMNKKKKILINPKTGEKIIIDRNKPENGGSMTVKDMIFLTELQIKSNQKNFSGFTEEEQRLYSEITKKLDNDSI